MTGAADLRRRGVVSMGCGGDVRGKIGRLMAECASGEFLYQRAEGFGDGRLGMI